MKLICILLFICLLPGCKVKKSLSVETERTTLQTEQKDVKQTGQEHTEITSQKETEAEAVTEGITVTYDTEKPVDPFTGKPPVKSETKWKKETKKKEKGETAQTVQKDTQSEDKSRTDTRQTEQVEVEQSQKKDIFRIPWFWVCVAAIGVVGIGYYIKRRV